MLERIKKNSNSLRKRNFRECGDGSIDDNAGVGSFLHEMYLIEILSTIIGSAEF